MNRLALALVLSICWAFLAAVPTQAAQKAQESRKPDAAQGSKCVLCHKRETPNVVTDWSLSKHAANGISCEECHGDAHTSAKDTQKAVFATPEVCRNCHEEQVAQYLRGKHAMAWASVNAMPTTHYQPMVLLQGQEGCTGCHIVGIKDEETARSLQKQGVRYGLASCDSCHTRHTFSTMEASQPQACRTCHMGFDHAQWEMWESSKHGVRYLLKQTGVLPPETPAPKCQTCHMPKGDHGVMTAWGFLAVRLPMPEDKQWAEDRTTILKGFGVLDPQGKPTARLEVVKVAKVARLTQEEWQEQRDRMLSVCLQCHSEGFARNELDKSDAMIRETDALLAGSIRTVAKLYQDGVLRKPKNYAFAYPDLLTFQDAPTMIETRLWLMFLEHRMRTFQGSFHQNPDYTFWYGWSEMIQDQNAIREMAGKMRLESGMMTEKGQAR